MSWSVSFGPCTVKELEDLEVEDQVLQNGLARDSFNESKEALVQMIYSGAFGDWKEFNFRGSFSGHANKDHKPDPAWADDFVSLFCYQVSK